MQEQTTESLWLSVITVAEIEKGIAKLEPGQNQQKLTRWFMSVQQWFTGRVLSFDTADAKVFGHICGLSEKAGHKLPMADALLAATALNHQLTLVTRNTKDFERTGAVIFDPWQV
jgi:predicted nucleic acid-binding protein